MAMLDEVCRATGTTPEEVIGTEVSDLDTGQDKSKKKKNRAAGAVGDRTDSPSCLFYSCFACEDGFCTALRDTNFGDRPCPFYKPTAQVEKERQDAFDRLLVKGRLDLINRYEDTLVELGVENPEDAEVPIDDDILAARAELQKYKSGLMVGLETVDEPEDEYDLGGLLNEEKDSGPQ